tara:strand:+ start:2786 stop:3391 length:606 start_codon:yes stop_codon:yes gene_type:complete
MHQSNVLIFGPKSFITTLDELKPFLKFNPYFELSNINYNALIFHKDTLVDAKNEEFLNKFNLVKIFASNKKDTIENREIFLELPATIKEINTIVEESLAKQVFNKNSSIKIKKYLLDKNEKKLIYKNNFLILTEKEIQLLELLLSYNKPITKKKILSNVWHYSTEADTHTVETHIYRLRKKINDKFSDENFILNSKEGYYF